MEAYANALLIAIPAFMVLMLTELIYGYATGKQTYVFMDTISSLSSGLTNILKDTLGLVVILISYPWLSQQLAMSPRSKRIFGFTWLPLSVSILRLTGRIVSITKSIFSGTNTSFTIVVKSSTWPVRYVKAFPIFLVMVPCL